jgi:hypothetical protein
MIKFVLPALLFFTSAAAFSIDWPSKDAVMVSNFGESYMGHPVLGDAFRAENTFNPIEKGEIIFRREASAPSSRFPSPLGVMAVVDHGDGILSIYSRCGELLADGQKEIEPVSAIANSGMSGWSKTSGFYLSIFDRKDRRWVNPALMIPVMNDTAPPVIRSVKLKGADNRIIDLATARSIKQGVYALIVHAEDAGGDGALMPMRIICSVNGLEAGVLAFETFSARDGALMLFRNGLVPVSRIYSYAPAVEAGEVFFNRGQVTLEIIVQDAAAVNEAGARSPDTSNARRIFYRLSVE